MDNPDQPSTGSSRYPENLETEDILEAIPEEPDAIMPENEEIVPNHSQLDEVMPMEVSTQAPSRTSGEGTPLTSTPVPSRRASIQVDEASGGNMPFNPIRRSEGQEQRPMPYPFSASPRPWPTPEARTTFMENCGGPRPRDRWSEVLEEQGSGSLGACGSLQGNVQCCSGRSFVQLPRQAVLYGQEEGIAGASAIQPAKQGGAEQVPKVPQQGGGIAARKRGHHHLVVWTKAGSSEPRILNM